MNLIKGRKEIIPHHTGLPQDARQCSLFQFGMIRHHATIISPAQNDVAATTASDFESQLLQDADDFPSREKRQARRHACELRL